MSHVYYYVQIRDVLKLFVLLKNPGPQDNIFKVSPEMEKIFFSRILGRNFNLIRPGALVKFLLESLRYGPCDKYDVNVNMINVFFLKNQNLQVIFFFEIFFF